MHIVYNVVSVGALGFACNSPRITPPKLARERSEQPLEVDFVKRLAVE
jgi:hypothetical protein